MAKIKTAYDKAEDIPEGFADLFTERNGKFELTGVEGVKTQADIDRINGALTKERTEHKATKEKLGKFGDLDPEKVPAALEELEEVKAQLATIDKDGKLDTAAVQERIDAAVNRAVGPLQRDKKALETQLGLKEKAIAEKDQEVGSLKGSILQSKIEGALRDAAVTTKVLGPAIDDAVMVGVRVFEIAEDGRVITKDGVGVTPGLEPKDWFKDMQEKRPHWWPASVGGGARTGGAPTGKSSDNPWSPEGWNITAQGQYVNKHGIVKANEAAASVNSKVGATKPTVTKAA